MQFFEIQRRVESREKRKKKLFYGHQHQWVRPKLLISISMTQFILITDTNFTDSTNKKCLGFSIE